MALVAELTSLNTHDLYSRLIAEKKLKLFIIYPPSSWQSESHIL